MTAPAALASAPAAPANAPALPLAEDCCAPLLREPLTPGQAADLARTLKALADPTRLRLVSMVAAHEGGEACVGVWAYYALRPASLHALAEILRPPPATSP
jgi:ArsR family transcriptional regulator, arsenate/arsenite/antimonite-responsive transcriptional repressor